MTRIAKLRDRIKGEFKERYGFPLTYLSFVTRAASVALREFPHRQRLHRGHQHHLPRRVNIGIAVALENGLIVPVIRNADEKSVPGIQRSIVDLANRARSRQLKPDEVQGGTFSITNFGSFGSLFATPVINQPQMAILGCGAVTKEPVVIEDAIGDPLDDVPGADLRSSPDRRRPGRPVLPEGERDPRKLERRSPLSVRSHKFEMRLPRFFLAASIPAGLAP